LKHILLVYKDKLQPLITKTEGLGHWQFWYGMDPEDEAPLATTPLPSPADKNVSVMHTYLQNEHIHSILTGAFTKLANTLNKPSVCSVPTLDTADDDEENDEEDSLQVC
jgi:hypothetical protein